MQIRYTNNSPDTLALRVGAARTRTSTGQAARDPQLFPADSDGAFGAFRADTIVREVRVNGQPVTTARSNDTMMRLDLPSASTTRRETTISMDFAFGCRSTASDRMGRDSSLYEIAQWYPRMAVYDDVRGWNTDPYLGQGEFYLEYGDIDYAVTVPAGYMVAASGVLQNPTEVLTAEQRRDSLQPLQNQRRSIVTESEAAASEDTSARRARRPGASGRENVRDVAWAALPIFAGTRRAGMES